MKGSVLLLIDGAINIVLGVLLLSFPTAVISILGLPRVGNAFYPNILGAILFGIGIALFIELRFKRGGLGFSGAIAINLCGGLVLALWLLFGSLSIPIRGYLLLWLLVIILVGVSLLELMKILRNRRTFTS